MKILNRKKGGEKYLSLWWFFCLVIIAGGIVLMVLVFSLSDVSTKKLESDILITRVFDCIIDNGHVNSEFLDNPDIFSHCNLNKDFFEKKGSEHFLSYKIYNMRDCKDIYNCENPILEKSYGPDVLYERCSITSVAKAENYPSCAERTVYVLSPEDEKLVFSIRAGSNQVVKSGSII